MKMLLKKAWWDILMLVVWVVLTVWNLCTLNPFAVFLVILGCYWIWRHGCQVYDKAHGLGLLK